MNALVRTVYSEFRIAQHDVNRGHRQHEWDEAEQDRGNGDSGERIGSSDIVLDEQSGAKKQQALDRNAHQPIKI